MLGSKNVLSYHISIVLSWIFEIYFYRGITQASIIINELRLRLEKNVHFYFRGQEHNLTYESNVAPNVAIWMVK